MSNDSPSRDSLSSNSAPRISILTEDSLPRDFSLVSINSTGSQDECFKSHDHAECLLKRMQNYLENKQLCDVVLIAGIDGKRYAIFFSFIYLLNYT